VVVAVNCAPVERSSGCDDVAASAATGRRAKWLCRSARFFVLLAVALLPVLTNFRTSLPGGDVAAFVVYPITILALAAFGIAGAIAALFLGAIDPPRALGARMTYCRNIDGC
jgi:hypothetical protein